MQAEYLNGYEARREVLAFHVYTFDPRDSCVDASEPQENARAKDIAAYNLREWRKHYKVTVSKRSVGAEKAKATVWCVTLTDKADGQSY